MLCRLLFLYEFSRVLLCLIHVIHILHNDLLNSFSFLKSSTPVNSSFLSNVVQGVILCAVGYPASFELMQFRAFATVDGHFDWDVKSVLQVPSKFPSSCNVRCSLVKTRVPVC